MSLSRDIVRLALSRAGAGLPERIERKVRLHIADSIAIACAAHREAPRAVHTPFSDIAGPCRVLGTDRGRDAPAAAFANSALAHVLDFDDIHDAARLHPTTVSLPSALAAADLAGASAQRVRIATALGNELMCRLGMVYRPSGSGPASNWFLTQLFGYFGGALAAGYVLDLDEDGLVSALGLASMQASGAKEASFGVGSNARSIYPAFAAMGGVQSALLARDGMTGPETAFEGSAGLFRVYLGGVPDDTALAALLHPDGWAFEATR